MDSKPENIKLNVENWRVRLDERSRDRMKLQVKLSKDEATAFKNFADVCKPEQVSLDDFIKSVFLTGIEALNKQLAELVRKYAVENKDELAASGITVIESEDGGVRLTETSGVDFKPL